MVGKKPREVYETDDDIENEKAAAKVIAKAFKCHILRNKKLYASDYALIKDDKIKAIGEIKVRTCSINEYETYFISAEKIMKCKAFAKEFNIPFFLFVWWSDGIHMLDVAQHEPAYLAMGGRKDRNDGLDVEPMAHYPTSLFKLISATV